MQDDKKKLQRKTLFEKWQIVSEKVRSLSGIIQNEIDYEEYMIDEWSKIASKVVEELSNIAMDTLEFTISQLKDKSRNE